jgi:hypothetical protein
LRKALTAAVRMPTTMLETATMILAQAEGARMDLFQSRRQAETTLSAHVEFKISVEKSRVDADRLVFLSLRPVFWPLTLTRLTIASEY